MHRSLLKPVALLVFAACLAASVATVRTFRERATSDWNRDGRPDVWRTFDVFGRLETLAIDTNFDGRSDIEESFDDGRIVRRESDRNFDDRVDRVESFNPRTRLIAWSITDDDFDGTADRRDVFHGGRLAFTERLAIANTINRAIVHTAVDARPATPAAHDARRLIQLTDPFASESSLDSAGPSSDRPDGLGASHPQAPTRSVANLRDPLAPAGRICPDDAALAPSRAVRAYAPRGPPARQPVA